jgi:hypothetical protein
VKSSARLPRVLSILLLTVLVWAATPFANLYSTPRPEPVESLPGVDRWPPPPGLVDDISVPMVHRGSGLPIRLPGSPPTLDFHVEQEVIDIYGLEPIEAAVERWSGVRGSTLRVRLAGVVDDGVERNSFDGVNRIFVNRRSCVSPELAKVHVSAREIDARFETEVIYLNEVNIGLCPSLRGEIVEQVIAHEIGHAVGFGHLCDVADRHECALPAEEESMRCRVMYSAATSCQAWEERDDRAVVRLYPLAPRIAGDDAAETAARTAHVLRPAAWKEDTVVVLDLEVDETLRWSATAAAGALRAPLLVAPQHVNGCASGEFARELSRIADFGAEVLLVGAAAKRCAPEMERWELDTTVITWAEELTDRVIAGLRSPKEAVIVGVDADGAVPFGVIGAALAGQAGSPLLFARDGVLDWHATQVIEEHGLTGAVLIGSRTSVPVSVAADLRRHGIIADRVLASTVGAASLQLADHRAFARAETVLIASARADDALVAVAHAPVVGAFPLLVDAEGITPGTGLLLSERLNAGYVIGRALAEPIAHQFNVWMDAPGR